MTEEELKELAALKAISNATKARIKELETQCKQELLDEYNDNGADRRRLKVNGNEVATASIVRGGGKIEIDYGAEYLAVPWLRQHALIDEKPAKAWEEIAVRRGLIYHVGPDVVDAETGEILGWCTYEPPYAKTAMIKGFDPQTVVGAFAGSLTSDYLAGLIGGGE